MAGIGKLSLHVPIRLTVTTGRHRPGSHLPAWECRNGLCASCRIYGLALECRCVGVCPRRPIRCSHLPPYCLTYWETIMVNFPGRNDRRRRVLKEEVISASSSSATIHKMGGSGSSSDAPRYSDA